MIRLLMTALLILVSYPTLADDPKGNQSVLH